MSDFAYRLKTAEIGAIVLDRDLAVADITPSAAALLGVEAGRLIGRPLLAIHAPEARAKVELLMAEARQARQAAASMIVPFPGRTVHVRACPLAGEGGGFIVILHDLQDETADAGRTRSGGWLLKVPVETGAVTLFVEPANVAYIEADGHYSRIQGADERHFCSLSLAELERRLDPAVFFRPHRSFLVNLRHVQAFRRREGSAELVMARPEGQVVPVSRTRVQDLRDRLAV